MTNQQDEQVMKCRKAWRRFVADLKEIGATVLGSDFEERESDRVVVEMVVSVEVEPCVELPN